MTTTGIPCVACDKPVRAGHYVNVYDDAGEVHVDCRQPSVKPERPTIDDGSGKPMTTYRLRGNPLVLETVE